MICQNFLGDIRHKARSYCSDDEKSWHNARYNVHIASKVTFINHDISVFMLRYMDENSNYKARTGEIVTGNNVFIGSNTTILYDVKIGNNVVIGAGSVVTKDIPDGVIAAGVPCKAIGEFDTWKEKMKI